MFEVDNIFLVYVVSLRLYLIDLRTRWINFVWFKILLNETGDINHG